MKVKFFHLLAVLFIIGLSGSFVSTAFAVGTPAGTIIQNTATATFDDVNGNPLLPVSDDVTTIVAQVCGVDVSPSTGSEAALAGSIAHYPVTITNTGNGDDTFDLTAVSGNGYTTNIYFDANGDGILDQSEIDAGPITSTVQLPADGTYRVIVVVDIPAETPDGTTDTLTLTATSRFDPAACTDSGTYTTTVSASVLTIDKTVDITNALPGDTITYTITYSNSGTAAVKDLVITDPIPAETTYVAGSITLNGVSQTDAAGDDQGEFSANNVIVYVGNVAPGESGTITFKVQVTEGVLAGTQISNVVTGEYNDENDVEQPPVVTPGPPVIVDEICGVLVEPNQAKSGNPGDTVVYAFTVTNTGNAPNLFNGDIVSTAGWTWEFYVDANGNGILDAGDAPATDSDGDGNPDTGSLDAGESKNYLAVTTVPPGTGDGTVDTTTLTAVGAEGGCSDFATLATTVIAPVLNINKTVSPTGEQPPGTVLTYTITVENIGSGVATDVVVADSVPANTTYIVNSVTLNGAAKTDAADADQVAVTAGSIVVSIGNMGPTASATITFQVTID